MTFFYATIKFWMLITRGDTKYSEYQLDYSYDDLNITDWPNFGNKSYHEKFGFVLWAEIPDGIDRDSVPDLE